MITTTSDSPAPTGLSVGRKTVSIVAQSLYVRYFFVAMGGLFVVINALGFVPQLMFIRAQKIPLHWFTHVHGAVMTGWLVLYLVQAILGARGRFKYHQQLGIIAAAWGLVVWITLGIVTFSALVRDNPPEQSMQFATLALSLAAIVLFGLFFTWGIRARKNAAIHKRMILLAMLPLMSAGIDRMEFLPALESAYFVRLIYLDLLLIPLVVYDCFTQQRIHRITVIGAACLFVTQGVVASAATSPVWHRFVYQALTPFVERLPEVNLSDAQSEPLLGAYGGKDWHMTFSREDGKLYIQFQNHPKGEMGAYSETTLFLKVAKMNFDFVKDPRGTVTKVVVTQPMVKTWEAPKIAQP